MTILYPSLLMLAYPCDIFTFMIELNETEKIIIKALENETLTVEELAVTSDYEVSGYFDVFLLLFVSVVYGTTYRFFLSLYYLTRFSYFRMFSFKKLWHQPRSLPSSKTNGVSSSSVIAPSALLTSV